MVEYLNSKLILGAMSCLAIGILLLDSHVDASAIRSRSSSEENSEERWGRDRDWRDRDKDKKKKNFKCPSSYGTFSDIEDCSAYFMCNNWKSKWKSCQKNKRFDRYRKVCLPFIIAVCDDGSDDKKTTRGVVGTTTPKDNSFTCPSFMGTFPDPNDCSKYYECAFFIPSLKTCEKNFLFDGVKKKCKPEREVNCGSRKRPTSETTVGTTPIPTRPEPTTTTSQPTTTPPTTPQPTTTPPTTPQPTTTPPTTPQPTTTPPTTPQPTTTPPTTPQPTTTPPTTPQPTTTPPTTPQPTTTPPTTPQPTTTPPTTPQPSTPTPKPTGPPETDCDEDDLDCIIKETGEIPEWFECPEDIGAYRHPSSNKLFIFCMNWKPHVKKCGQNLVYSEKMRTCVTP
ncbi:uncharacterized protein [Parasteatoda tepidariorum]|uniref:uncharacterized protein n=1 Tax=Parasteatoda tepidariorum TaxID=114398 RepID=UPI001C71BA3A|nr:proteoglycan 4-like [Parasteatoda tepidariorum]